MKALLIATLMLTSSLVIFAPTAAADANVGILDLPACPPDPVWKYYCRVYEAYHIVYDAYLAPIDEVYDCIVNGDPPCDLT